jgi:hypothetical protein
MRDVRDVIVLGSGMSILELSKKDIKYINNCEVVIAINKFMAFYKKSGIVPTHIYYVDNYQDSVKLFLQYIFNVCRKDNLKNLIFIVNKKMSDSLTSNKYLFYSKKAYRKIKYGEKSKKIDLFLVPKNCKFNFITHQDWLNGDAWASSLDEPLFHYRGSLSTVLNYISIQYPNRHISLVGVDFNSSKYFFQNELEKLSFQWQDWTTPLTKEKSMHFSAIDYQGKTIFDKFEFMINQLNLSGNSMSCPNSKSLVVEKELVKYIPLGSHHI